jgi:hypothetical protein
VGVGLAAGALIGGALAAPYWGGGYYAYDPGYYGYYAPVAYGPGWGGPAWGGGWGWGGGPVWWPRRHWRHRHRW